MSSTLTYIVKPDAPSTVQDLFNSTSLIIWSGGSDSTIYGDASVNYAFRAVHDMTHLETRLNFTPEHEIEMGRIQAAKLASRCESLMADLFYCEIALQAAHYLQHGDFVADQKSFTELHLGLKF